MHQKAFVAVFSSVCMCGACVEVCTCVRGSGRGLWKSIRRMCEKVRVDCANFQHSLAVSKNVHPVYIWSLNFAVQYAFCVFCFICFLKSFRLLNRLVLTGRLCLCGCHVFAPVCFLCLVLCVSHPRICCVRMSQDLQKAPDVCFL